MSHSFKPGDLALIKNCRYPENIGRCVELKENVAPGEYYLTPYGFRVCNATDVAVWLVEGHALINDLHGSGWAQKAEFNLMPLRGDFTLEQQKAKEAEPCE